MSADRIENKNDFTQGSGIVNLKSILFFSKDSTI